MILEEKIKYQFATLDVHVLGVKVRLWFYSVRKGGKVPAETMIRCGYFFSFDDSTFISPKEGLCFTSFLQYLRVRLFFKDI